MFSLHFPVWEKFMMMKLMYSFSNSASFIKGHATSKLMDCEHVNMPVFKSTTAPFDKKTSCPLAQKIDTMYIKLEFALIV